MRTTKPVSTISFNTEPYLRLKLDELRKAKKISFWAFVNHLPEDDEGGKKSHIHLYLEPSALLQTDDLREFLKEYDPNNPSKPLGCLIFNHSVFDHWYMYVLHDKRYLASKNQSRRFQYLSSEVKTSDDDDLTYKVKQIDILSLSPYSEMQDAIIQGLTFEEFFRRGTIPIQQIKCFQTAWHLLVYCETFRNGRKTHVDEETGMNCRNV